MDLKDYIRLVVRRWPTIVSLTLISILLAAVYTIRTTPVYESSVEMFISSPTSSSTEQYQNQLFSQQRAKSYVRLLTGKDVARRVIDELDLDLTPSEFAKEVSAEVVGDTVLLRATVSDTDPADAQRYAKALGQVFVAYVAQLETPVGASTPPIKLSVVAQPDLPGSPAKPQVALYLGSAPRSACSWGWSSRPPGSSSTRRSARSTTSATSSRSPCSARSATTAGSRASRW